MTSRIEHPGAFVRANVIPADLTVKKAAELLEVSRPALSNLLNGNADLSAEMATRLEAAFGFSARTLLDRQSAWDAAHRKRTPRATAIKAYVPPFLQIKAARIEEWASSGIMPRQRLSVLLRTLVNSTGADLAKVDFPGNDDAERSGWDGEIIADQPTPWIPAGHSGWEFGVNSNIKGKADGDFAKSVGAFDSEQRMSLTFVFVTPRVWAGKSAWIREQMAKKLWKDVRAYDASDLEQWLEQSLSGQVWFASETGQETKGAISLDEAWKNWLADCDPTLSPSLFADAIQAAKPTLQSVLTETPNRPLVLAADSKDEALAFLSAAFAADSDALGMYRDRIIVFREPGSLSKLASQASNFIPVITSRDVETEFAPFKSSMPSFILYPRNALADAPDIDLETLGWHSFDTALEAMKFDRDRIQQLARESGRSRTVLRRRLSKLPAIKTPDWASNLEWARSLIPFLLGGVWKADNTADQAMLELLAGDVPFDELERSLATLLLLDSSPVWSIGSLRGVVSKVDLLFAIRSVITTADLDRFFSVAGIVLSEEDPSLELPEKDRWAAGIYGKTREISGALRRSLGETLAMLATYGQQLFKPRLNFDTQARTDNLVRSLLLPISAKSLESQIDNLGVYAEAAPETFLSIIEADLSSEDPAAMALMRPMSDALFGSSPRTRLLWALEGLAWSDALFMRTVLVLGKLAERPLSDNLVNKPANSLAAIFRAWMPQTSASLNARKAALKRLADKYPGIVWPICIDQFSPRSRIGYHSNRPRWSLEGQVSANSITGEDANAFALFCFDMALEWRPLSRSMICDLIDHLTGVHEELQPKVWEVIGNWIETADEEDKSVLREKVRTTTMTKRALLRKEKRGARKAFACAKAIYERLESSDPVHKHSWLFRSTWVEESADEIADDSFDYSSREKRIAQQREDAVREVYTAQGADGLMRLAASGDAGHSLGWAFAAITDDDTALLNVLVDLVEGGEVEGARSAVIRGILMQLPQRSLLQKMAERVSYHKLIALFTSAPFCRETWNVVDTLGIEISDRYWSAVAPAWNRDPEEIDIAVNRLLTAGRPRAAFQFCHWEMKELSPRLIFNLLVSVCKGADEPSGSYLLHAHHLRDAFKLLNESGDIKRDEMAPLEFQFIDIFDHDQGRPLNLEAAIAEEPELFVQAVGFAFKRSDGVEDGQEFRSGNDQIRKNQSHAAHKLLDVITRIPGMKDDGTVDSSVLIDWIEQVRSRSATMARVDIADQMIGKLLSHAPANADGVWPCTAVRDALEHVITEHIDIGIRIALFNARGVHSRGEGGSQEREIAARYARWAEVMDFTHPRVAAMHRKMEQSYLRDAEREDTHARANRRLIH